MGYFNPLSYFIRNFIRLFTRKFFWVILILICLFLGFILFYNDGVFAESNYSFIDNYFTDSDINTARNLVTESIWNNNNYDIWLLYRPADVWEKCVIFYDTSNVPNGCHYVSNFSSFDAVNYYGSWKLGYINLVDNTNNNYNIGTWTCISLYKNFSQSFPNVSTADVISRWCSNYNDDSLLYMKPIRTNFNWYDNNDNLIFNATNPRFTTPYIVNSSDVSNWSFDNLIISPGSLTYDISNYYGLIINNGYDNSVDLSSYYNINDNTFVIPKNQLSNYINIRDGNTINFEFSYRSMTSVNLFDLGNYTIILTTEEENNINEDSEKYVQGQILEEQQKTTKAVENVDNSVNNLNNSITDSSIDDITDNDLPSDDTEDITAEGVNGIFTSIYNAFCTGNAQDIVFPIPFTNKNITLSANYVNNMLSNSGASWVITIIQAFWWYLISRFIIKDVMNKINKIKSGNIEDIETTNIRGDML